MSEKVIIPYNVLYKENPFSSFNSQSFTVLSAEQVAKYLDTSYFSRIEINTSHLDSKCILKYSLHGLGILVAMVQGPIKNRQYSFKFIIC